MSPAIESSIGIVGYLALFAGVGVVFLFVNLLVGRFLRPDNPSYEKQEIYECGEPTIGSSFVQFDLRFYVVALLFIIFDVEVAFFFPWATVFGKSVHMMDRNFAVVEQSADGTVKLTKDAALLYQELGVRNPTLPVASPEALKTSGSLGGNDVARSTEFIKKSSRDLALFSIIDIAVFFGVLLVGFAYVWKRGDLDWVRAVSKDRSRRANETEGGERARESALSA